MFLYKNQMSESFPIGIALTLTGGFLDSYSYVCRGGVFANAQTGNLVLFAKGIADRDFAMSMRYIFPIFAFACGIFISEIIRQKLRYMEVIHWRQIILLFEILLLTIAGFLPNKLDILSNTLISMTCAMQANTFRKFKGNPYATTMCTGNIKSATEKFAAYTVTGDRELLRKSLDYSSIIVIFAIGAAVGSVISIYLGIRAVWIVNIFLMGGILLMFKKEEEIKRENNR